MDYFQQLLYSPRVLMPYSNYGPENEQKMNDLKHIQFRIFENEQWLLVHVLHGIDKFMGTNHMHQILLNSHWIHLHLVFNQNINIFQILEDWKCFRGSSLWANKQSNVGRSRQCSRCLNFHSPSLRKSLELFSLGNRPKWICIKTLISRQVNNIW